MVEERPKVAVGEPEGDQSASLDGEVEEAWLKQFRNFTLGQKCQVVFTYKYIQMLFWKFASKRPLLHQLPRTYKKYIGTFEYTRGEVLFHH